MGNIIKKSAAVILCCAAVFSFFPDSYVPAGAETGIRTDASDARPDEKTKDNDTGETECVIDYSSFAQDGYYSFSVMDTNISDNSGYTCFELDVQAGERYRIKGTVWAWACLYKVADDSGNVLSIFDWEGKYNTDVPPESFSETVEIPEGGTKLLVSFQTGSFSSVEKLKSAVRPAGTVSERNDSGGTFVPEYRKNGYSYAISNTLCIGDSLTSGAYFREPLPRNMRTGDSIRQNYPYYLKRMNSMDNVTNAGVSGITVNGWLASEFKKYKPENYDSVIIWLGSNGGVQGSLEKDVKPFSEYSKYANTGVGNYCTIIEKIREVNPDCFIVLCTVYETTTCSDVSVTNENICSIASRYGLNVIDMSDLSYSSRPELHGNYNNIHFTKAGNIFVADRIITEINRIFSDNPALTEFGISKRTE